MKVLMLGDTHFQAGYSFGKPDQKTGLNSRLLDYENTASNVVSYAIKNSIPLFVFLGDIFETRTPSSQALVVFYRLLKRLSDAGITTYIISGNHDQSKARRITSSLDPIKELRLPNIFTFNDIDLVPFTDANGDSVNVLLVPYRNRHTYDKLTNVETIAEMRKEVETAKAKGIPGAPLIVCSHMMMEGVIPAEAGEYANTNELIVPYNVFDGANLVVNGHIHRPSILKEDPPVINVGSMECKDFSEREHQKCFLVYDTNKIGMDAVAFKAIPTRKFVEFAVDFGNNWPVDPMKEIAAQINKTDIRDAVVRCNVRVPEVKVPMIDLFKIRGMLYEYGANLISDVSVSPIVSRQLRNQKVNEAPDDVSAFKHFISAQTNVADDVLQKGLEIMKSLHK